MPTMHDEVGIAQFRPSTRRATSEHEVVSAIKGSSVARCSCFCSDICGYGNGFLRLSALHNDEIVALKHRQGAHAPLGSRLRWSDEGWGHSTSTQPSTMPPLRHPSHPHSVILRNPTPSPYTSPFRHPPPPFRHPPPPIPSSSAKAGDPVREYAFLPRSGHKCSPTHVKALTRHWAPACAGATRGGDIPPPSNHPPCPRYVILSTFTASSSATPLRHHPPPTPSSSALARRHPPPPPLRHLPRRRRIQFAQLRIIFHVALNIVVKHRHHYRLVTTQPPSKSPTAAPNQCK